MLLSFCIIQKTLTIWNSTLNDVPFRRHIISQWPSDYLSVKQELCRIFCLAATLSVLGICWHHTCACALKAIKKKDIYSDKHSCYLNSMASLVLNTDCSNFVRYGPLWTLLSPREGTDCKQAMQFCAIIERKCCGKPEEEEIILVGDHYSCL